MAAPTRALMEAPSRALMAAPTRTRPRRLLSIASECAPLVKTGGLADVVLPDGDKAGQSVKTTLLPVALQGARLPVRLDPPRFGAHTQELLEGLGYERTRIDALRARRAVA